MDSNHKKRCVTCAEDDIISNLSDHLVDVIRTSVLSKKWRYRWTTIKVLRFSKKFSEKLLEREAFHHNEVIKIINKIMINPKGPILKFGLAIPYMVLDSFPEIDQWMLILSRNNFLTAEKFPWCLPHAVKHLRQLEFQSFSFGDLDQLEGALCIIRNSPNLKVLRVTHMPMGSDADLELTSSYLESSDCLQTLFMLQTLEMTSLEGSRPELLLADTVHAANCRKYEYPTKSNH